MVDEGEPAHDQNGSTPSVKGNFAGHSSHYLRTAPATRRRVRRVAPAADRGVAAVRLMFQALGTKLRMPFDLQPILKGRLLELRPLRADDFQDLCGVAADPLIWEQHPAKDRYKAEVFGVFFHEALASGGALIAVEIQDRKVIGSSRFHGHNEEKGEIEIGWTFLARSYWGGLYNGEMKQLMLRHAFRFVDNVIFLVGPENFRSQKAVEKLGAIRVGSRPDAGGRTSLVYQITALTFAQHAFVLEDQP